MAASYKLYDGSVLGLSVLGNADTTPTTALGTIGKGFDTSSSAYGEAEFIYVKFSGTVAAGDCVILDRFNKTAVVTPTSATKALMLGISMAAQTSSTYGWVMIRGVHDAASVLNGATVATGPNYGSALVAGRVTSAVTSNYILDGIAIRVTGNGSSVGTVEVNYATCSGR